MGSKQIMVINRINKDGAKQVTLRPCKNCGFLGHTAFTCRRKVKKPLKATKRMNKLGRVGKALAQQAKDFKAELKPPYRCFYCVYLGYDIPLEIEYLQAEHTKSKVRHPGFRLDKGKLVLSCSGHNQQKSSLDIEDFLKILDKEKINARQ